VSISPMIESVPGHDRQDGQSDGQNHDRQYALSSMWCRA